MDFGVIFRRKSYIISILLLLFLKKYYTPLYTDFYFSLSLVFFCFILHFGYYLIVSIYYFVSNFILVATKKVTLYRPDVLWFNFSSSSLRETYKKLSKNDIENWMEAGQFFLFCFKLMCCYHTNFWNWFPVDSDWHNDWFF